MNIDELLDKILEENFTINKLKVRFPLLREYMVAYFFGDKIEFEKTHSGSDLEWIKSFDQAFFDSFTKTNVYETLDAIQKKIDEIKPLVIYLAFIIPIPELVLLGQKLRADFGKRFIFELKYDPNLIAGCALVWNGVYKDYSLKANIQTKKNDILQNFKAFLSK